MHEFITFKKALTVRSKLFKSLLLYLTVLNFGYIINLAKLALTFSDFTDFIVHYLFFYQFIWSELFSYTVFLQK